MNTSVTTEIDIADVTGMGSCLSDIEVRFEWSDSDGVGDIEVWSFIPGKNRDQGDAKFQYMTPPAWLVTALHEAINDGIANNTNVNEDLNNALREAA